jgi:hypothetical protein
VAVRQDQGASGVSLRLASKNGNGPVRFEEKSIVALSTGSHCARHELWPKHIDGGKKNYEEMMRGIVGAVRMISISGVRLRN